MGKINSLCCEFPAQKAINQAKKTTQHDMFPVQLVNMIDKNYQLVELTDSPFLVLELHCLRILEKLLYNASKAPDILCGINYINSAYHLNLLQINIFFIAIF